jgi:hypothetical protein
MLRAMDSNAVPNGSAVENRDAGVHREVAKPYRFLYAVFLAVTISSFLMNLFFLVWIYGPADASKIALGIFVTCLCISMIPFVPFALRWRKANGGRIDMRTIMNVYSWRKTGWIDKAVTVALFATIFIAFAFFMSHGHPQPH